MKHSLALLVICFIDWNCYINLSHFSNYRIHYSSIELREQSNRNIVIEITEIELPCNFLLMYRLCLTGNECGPDTADTTTKGNLSGNGKTFEMKTCKEETIYKYNWYLFDFKKRWLIVYEMFN